MDKRFEAWARDEISRHRSESDRHKAEAERLECVLNQFLSAAQNNGAGNSRSETAASQEHTRGRRTSKNDAIFQAFVDAGPAGLDMDEVEQFARSAGIESSRDTLRAYCWNQKKAGRLIGIAPGRHAIAPGNEAADPASTGESAASDHNQHREGDAGGIT